MTEQKAIDEAFADIAKILESEADFEKKQSQAIDQSWLPNWYLKKLTDFAAERKKLKAQHEVRQAQVDAEERALSYNWGLECRKEIELQIEAQTGKKKSIDFDYGRAGSRTVAESKRLDIIDEKKAIDAITESCPEALKIGYSKTRLRKFFDETGEELPGTELITTPRHEIF